MAPSTHRLTRWWKNIRASGPENPTSFLALVVAKVDEKELRNDGQGRLNTSNLPTKLVSLPVPDVWKVAVLSWRWDTARPGLSLNILAAVRHAKSMGIKYLFIDTISIDQHRSGDDLIKDIFAFSKLYETIPVIAAYDVPHEVAPLVRGRFYKTVVRPWIIHEMRKYRNNPYRVTYVGHQSSGGLDSGSEDPESFGVLTHFIWSVDWSGYLNTIMGVLTGNVGMAVISDFRYLIPEYAHVIDVAYISMSRNDYLLTIALLCQAATKSPFSVRESHLEPKGETERATLPPNTFTRYTVVRKAANSDNNDFRDYFDISLDGQPIGEWEVRHNSGIDRDTCLLHTSPNTEYSILEALHLEDEFEDFVNNEPARKESMGMGSNTEPRKPSSIASAFVNLDDVYVHNDAKTRQSIYTVWY